MELNDQTLKVTQNEEKNVETQWEDTQTNIQQVSRNHLRQQRKKLNWNLEEYKKIMEELTR